MVSISDVVLAYRVILGREPESFEAIRFHMHAENIDILRRTLVTSEEFQQSNEIFFIGQHLDCDVNNVDVFASDDDMNRMLKRVSREWKRLGEREPYWSVLTKPKFQQDKIVYTKKEFFDTGSAEIRRVRAMLNRNGLQFPTGCALDFGCGVGRLSFSLAPFFTSVIGVDFSSSHVELARREQIEAEIKNVSFKLIDSIEDINHLPRVGFILSLIVLQHNPPPVIMRILKAMLSRLDKGGVAVFQVPVFKSGYMFNTRDYLAEESAGDMEMHVLPQKDVHSVLRELDLDVIEVREDAMTYNWKTISQTYLVYRRDNKIE